MPSSAERWSILTTRAAEQHGLLTRRQLLEVLSPKELETRRRACLIEPVVRSVYRIAGSPATFRQRVLASCLYIGPMVAASHLTAGRLWDFEAVRGRRGNMHLTVPHERRGTRSALDARVYRAILATEEVTARHGIPVTTAIRTLGDLASLVSSEILAHCSDEALRRGLVSPEDLGVLDAGWRRRPGAPAIHAVAAARAGGIGDSGWEDRVFGWLVAAGLPPPVRQHPVLLPDGPVRLDLAYPDENVGIEFDGWAWHRGRQRFDRDRIRATELTLAGWTIVQVTSAQSEREVVERVRRALLQSQAS